MHFVNGQIISINQAVLRLIAEDLIGDFKK